MKTHLILSTLAFTMLGHIVCAQEAAPPVKTSGRFSLARLQREMRKGQPLPQLFGIYPSTYIEGTDYMAVACQVYRAFRADPAFRDCAKGPAEERVESPAATRQADDCPQFVLDALQRRKPLDTYPKMRPDPNGKWKSHILEPLNGDLVACNNELRLYVPLAGDKTAKNRFEERVVWRASYKQITAITQGFIPKSGMSGTDVTLMTATLAPGLTALTASGITNALRFGVGIPLVGVGGFFVLRALYDHFRTADWYYLIVSYASTGADEERKKAFENEAYVPVGDAAAFALDMESFWPLVVIIGSKEGIPVRTWPRGASTSKSGSSTKSPSPNK